MLCGKQFLSKWEQGLSVPDSDMLISISEVLETPVSTLLGETVTEAEVDNLKAISEKLEVINLQLAQKKTTRRKIIRWLLVSLCVIIVMTFVILIIWSSSYLGWDYSDPETAVIGVAFHSFEHSCASLLLANGVPLKQIQEWLGHSDFSTTANIYAHLDYTSKLSSAKAMVSGMALPESVNFGSKWAEISADDGKN